LGKVQYMDHLVDTLDLKRKNNGVRRPGFKVSGSKLKVCVVITKAKRQGGETMANHEVGK